MDFNFEKIFLGNQDWSFIPEILLRTLIMYVIVLISLRVLGKRGVKQLSVFELVVIISLGSAAGDPMFYKEVGILSALSVFTVIVLAYKFTSYLVNKSERIETILEGQCTYLIENGKFAVSNFKKESLAQDEFFSELRLKGISHLGQIDLAILETSGSLSVFFFADKDVKAGLPILPRQYNKKLKRIVETETYSCNFCGHTQTLDAGNHHCPICDKTVWIKSSAEKRIT